MFAARLARAELGAKNPAQWNQFGEARHKKLAAVHVSITWNTSSVKSLTHDFGRFRKLIANSSKSHLAGREVLFKLLLVLSASTDAHAPGSFSITLPKAGSICC